VIHVAHVGRCSLVAKEKAENSFMCVVLAGDFMYSGVFLSALRQNEVEKAQRASRAKMTK
jgi:hypothetical protein